MKPKTLILTFVAVACGLGASYMTAQLLGSAQSEPEEKTQYLVARRNLSMADHIKKPEEMFELKSFTRDNAPYGGLTKFEDVKGRVLKISRRAGDAIHPEDLYAENDPTWGPSSNLPKGYRAVGLKVTLEGGVHGWATLPMSRVDVINTVRRGGDKDSFAHFLLQDVLVLAIDNKDIREESGRPMTGSVVTFALSPDDCLRMSLARDMGTLTLALRNIHDNGIGSSGVITGDQIVHSTRGAIARGEETAADGMSFGPNAASQAIPNLPMFDKDAVRPAVEATEKGPDGRPYRMEVRQGTVSTTVRYLLDDHDRPIPTEDRRPE